jgi:hypothetical protein
MVDLDASTRAVVKTEPGVVLGTAIYPCARGGVVSGGIHPLPFKHMVYHRGEEYIC